ncbi:MAG TPA: hypothetical protein VGM07_04980 [Stellaceae bacterium]
MLLQLLATAAALGWVPSNLAKLAAMLAIWAAGFRRLRRAELVLMLGVNAIFVVANGGALHNGVFRFDHPDLLGMPAYEFLMWGFYTLHTIRVVGGRPPRFQPIATLLLVALFAAAFSTIRDPQLLLLVAVAIVAAGLGWFREPADFAYAGYMVAVGAVIEYVGVGTGQWSYPAAPVGGVPLWFVPMWAGVGLFTRRLFLPALDRLGSARRPGRPAADL